MVLQVAALAAVVAVVLVWLPRVLFPLSELPGTFLDRAIAGAVLMTALTAVVMYVLGSVDANETLPLVAAWAVTWWLVRGRHRAGRLGDLAVRIFAFLDSAESGAARAALPRVGRPSVALRLPPVRANEILPSAALLVVLAIAARQRFAYALGHFELVPEDSYLALSLMKHVNEGHLFGEGTYPQGLYIWMSMLERFYPFGSYAFTRFVGPFTALVELVVLYWTVSRLTSSRAAGVASTAVFGLLAGHAWMLVTWPRQIGALPMEFALAFALVALVNAARFVRNAHRWELLLATASVFVACTTHILVTPLLVIGFGVVLGVGVVARAPGAALVRLAAATLVAAAAGNAYFVIGLLRGVPLQQAFTLYEPSNPSTVTQASGAFAAGAGHELSTNPVFRAAIASCALAAVAGALRRRSGRPLLAVALAVACTLLLVDLGLARFGPLFRLRQSWIAGELIAVALGLGAGALAAAVPRVRLVLAEACVVALAGVCVAMLAPGIPAQARTVAPSGYPQAARVSLDIIGSEDRFTYTFVGVSEQLQESLGSGYFVEAWVFARDVVMSEAAHPGHELGVPTDRVYVFAEKTAFEGPQVLPYGPNAEYYRDTTRRARIMRRIAAWCEIYRRHHTGVDVIFEDDVLRVYRISRRVDVGRAELAGSFRDYTWRPGELFDDDADVTADRISRAGG